MEETCTAIKAGEPPPSGPVYFRPWPVAVQLALVVLATACVFFLLGRYSTGAGRTPDDIHEPAGPALDLNRATRAELRLLPGIGDSLAQRIVEHRQQGPFRSVDDLRSVRGIGPKTLERVRPFVFVAPPEDFVAMEDAPAMPSESRPANTSKGAPAPTGKAAKLTDPVNVNRADSAELQRLPGIGPKMSQRILDERVKTPFKSIDDLRRVPGIGPKTFEKIRPHVTIE